MWSNHYIVRFPITQPSAGEIVFGNKAYTHKLFKSSHSDILKCAPSELEAGGKVELSALTYLTTARNSPALDNRRSAVTKKRGYVFNSVHGFIVCLRWIIVLWTELVFVTPSFFTIEYFLVIKLIYFAAWCLCQGRY